MPELPEVEVVRRGLEEALLNSATADRDQLKKTPSPAGNEIRTEILSFRFLRPDLRDPIPIKSFRKLEGARLLKIERRAKYLLFHTDRGGFISHLGMSGHWRITNDSKDKENFALKLHDHILIHLDVSGAEKVLIYNDPRRFGIFETVDLNQLEKYPRFENLAPEPFAPEFNGSYLYQVLKPKKVPVKSAIMDQGLVVGVGNIYASEVLFALGIRPSRSCRRLTLQDCEKLVTQIKATLSRAIDSGGSTISNFFKTDGNSGDYQQNHKVYGREGLLCPNGCSHQIRMRVISGRSTFWCPSCQK